MPTACGSHSLIRFVPILLIATTACVLRRGFPTSGISGMVLLAGVCPLDGRVSLPLPHHLGLGLEVAVDQLAAASAARTSKHVGPGG